MQEEELIKLLDSYMENDGYYMKPKVIGDEASFFIAKGPASAKNVKESFDEVKDNLGDKQEKTPQIFSGTPNVECVVCADVPNISDLDKADK